MPPSGFLYLTEVMTPDEERALIADIHTLPLAAAIFRGFTARRRIVHFEDTVPAFLLPLRDRAARLAGVDAATLTKALVTEYSPGAVIGWHRDAPQYGPVVIGASLGAACRMRFRRIPAHDAAAVERASIVLEPRSLYVMGGESRSEWQHSIPAVDALRYSITFRSLRPGRARSERAYSA
jgi:alkylated DNA repair protein (DNA oxidative demethylase)